MIWHLDFEDVDFFLKGLFLIYGCAGSSLPCVLSQVVVVWGFSSLWNVASHFSSSFHCREQVLGRSCSVWTQQLCRAWVPCSMWDLPGPRIEPKSPALQGGLLTTRPPGRPCIWIYSWLARFLPRNVTTDYLLKR